MTWSDETDAYAQGWFYAAPTGVHDARDGVEDACWELPRFAGTPEYDDVGSQLALDVGEHEVRARATRGAGALP